MYYYNTLELIANCGSPQAAKAVVESISTGGYKNLRAEYGRSAYIYDGSIVFRNMVWLSPADEPDLVEEITRLSQGHQGIVFELTADDSDGDSGRWYFMDGKRYWQEEVREIPEFDPDLL